MKKIIISIIAIVVLLIAIPVNAEFAITFRNDTTEKVIYTLKWFDHNLDHFGPVYMAGGELMPGAENIVDYNYVGKIWIVSWNMLNKDKDTYYQFPIGDSLYHFTVTPNSCEVKDVFESIYNWTLGTMLLKLPFEPDKEQIDILLRLKQPKIDLITREELKKKWLLYNGDCIVRWEKKYGKEKAKEYVDYYLNESKAFFIPGTKEIFIWDKLTGIDRDAIIAHEITHYFQDALKLPHPNCEKENKIFYREMQAHQVEELYKKENSKDEKE